MTEAYPILTLLPPLLAITLVITTKRVLVSLFSGVVLAALLVADLNLIDTAELVWNSFAQIFWADGSINSYYVLIIVFLLVLGIITSLVMMAGGTQAFSQMMGSRIRTRRGAQVLGAALGTAIFIDDYFNALAVGQIARPVCDRQKVSRAKLAYLIDSSSAPIAVLAPFSSWGASIIGIMAPILATSTLTLTDAGAFIRAATMNYYAIAAVVLLWLTVRFGIDFGPMRREEIRAASDQGLHADGDVAPGQLTDKLPRHEPGAVRSLVVPFVLLVIGVIAGMFITGARAGGSWNPMEALANTDVAGSLNYGGLAGLASAAWYCWRHTHRDPAFSPAVRFKGAIAGAKSMLPAIEILLLAWMLGSLIGELGTGDYLGSLVAGANMGPQWLIPLMFLVAAAMAFATGTSWGSFGILLPIAGEIMTAVPGGEAFLLASFGAVLAGAVFGDHCSPISDTTILSATGAACSLTTHVNTQLPYALVGAGASLVGYLTLAITRSGLVGLIVTLVMLAGFTIVMRRRYPCVESEISA